MAVLQSQAPDACDHIALTFKLRSTDLERRNGARNRRLTADLGDRVHDFLVDEIRSEAVESGQLERVSRKAMSALESRVIVPEISAISISEVAIK